VSIEIEGSDKVTLQSSVQQSEPTSIVPVKKKHGRFFNQWFLLLAIAIVYLLVAYINRSTPEKTLATFCDALAHGQYQAAYDQLTTVVKNQVPEEKFATVWVAKNANGKIGNCIISHVSDNGASGFGTMTYTVAGGSIESNRYALVNESSVWKISDCLPDCDFHSDLALKRPGLWHTS
jgi:hypothetical protein